MANSRLITSDVWTDDWFGPLSFFEQALWIGLFSRCADDQGRLIDNPVVIRAAVFPYKDTPIADIEAALVLYAEAGRVIRYVADDKKLLQIANWWEHQHPQWAQPSKWLAPEGWTDRVRTRINGRYVVENWADSEGSGTSSGERVPERVGSTSSARQDPDPNPVYNPNPIKDTECGATAPAAEAAAPAPTASVDDAASEQEPVKPKRNDIRSDPRSKHPAIQCVRGIMGGKYPPREMYDAILETLGERPDGVRAANCRKAWVERGFNRASWIWLTEWYPQGGPPAKNVPRNNGHGNGLAAVDEAIRKFAEGG